MWCRLETFLRDDEPLLDKPLLHRNRSPWLSLKGDIADILLGVMTATSTCRFQDIRYEQSRELMLILSCRNILLLYVAVNPVSGHLFQWSLVPVVSKLPH